MADEIDLDKRRRAKSKIVDLKKWRDAMLIQPGEIRWHDSEKPSRVVLQIDEDCRLSVEEPHPNKPGMILIETPAGLFKVGYCDDEDALDDMMKALSFALLR